MTAEAKAEPVPDAPKLDVADSPEAKLTAALANAQGEFPPIPKTKTAVVKTKGGAEYSYSYADLADILAAVRPTLARHGLAMMQRTVRDGAAVVLKTDLRHVGGGTETSEVDLGRNASDPQQFGGALTYLRRYELVTLLGLSPEDDRDGQDITPATNTPAPPLPDWVQPLQAQAAKAAFMADLEIIVGKDHAKVIAKEGAAAYGGIPGIAADLVHAMAQAIAPPAPPEADAERQAQDEAAEAGDVSRETDPSPAPVDGTPTDRAPAGTVEAPALTGVPTKDIEALRDAGCICDSPLEAGVKGGPLGAADDACPIKEHGIPF